MNCTTGCHVAKRPKLPNTLTTYTNGVIITAAFSHEATHAGDVAIKPAIYRCIYCFAK